MEGEGVFRLFEGSWKKSTGVTIGSTERSQFIWPDSGNSGVVFLLDLSSGLYRSSDGGQRWMNLWPAMRFRNNDFYNTGYIAADDANPTVLYLSIQADKGSPIGSSFKVLRLANADIEQFGTLQSPHITDISRHSGDTKIERPGPLVIGPGGRLWLTQQQDARKGVDAALFVMDEPATDRSFKVLTTQAYRYSVTSPSGIAASRDGHLYISQNGTGVVKIALPCSHGGEC